MTSDEETLTSSAGSQIKIQAEPFGPDTVFLRLVASDPSLVESIRDLRAVIEAAAAYLDLIEDSVSGPVKGGMSAGPSGFDDKVVEATIDVVAGTAVASSTLIVKAVLAELVRYLKDKRSKDGEDWRDQGGYL